MLISGGMRDSRDMATDAMEESPERRRVCFSLFADSALGERETNRDGRHLSKACHLAAASAGLGLTSKHAHLSICHRVNRGVVDVAYNCAVDVYRCLQMTSAKRSRIGSCRQGALAVEGI